MLIMPLKIISTISIANESLKKHKHLIVFLFLNKTVLAYSNSQWKQLNTHKINLPCCTTKAHKNKWPTENKHKFIVNASW